RENEKISTFKNSLDKIKEHIIELQSFGKIEKTSKRFFEFAKLLGSRGYLLNAITLLLEAIGCYCLESLKEIDNIVKEYVESFDSHYDQTQTSRSIIAKFRNSETKKNKEDAKEKIIDFKENAKEKINIFLKSKNIENFQKFIEDARELRNNLAHGNNRKKIEDARKIFDELVEEYKVFCIDNDILSRI
ncbi:MAG: hypothetical protein LBF97_07480, partial [Elusimicrobiota bacterium]|nr:hypothetical protein [Elusimicrobiota bacterium]